jgi:hypothetical protein
MDMSDRLGPIILALYQLRGRSRIISPTVTRCNRTRRRDLRTAAPRRGGSGRGGSGRQEPRP